MKSKTIFILTILVITSISFCTGSFADGVFVPSVTGKLPDIPIQRALIKYRDGAETLIVEATLDGEGQSFGWVIPVPNIPQTFSRVSPGFLKTLSMHLEPEVIHKYFRELWQPLFILGFILSMCLVFVFEHWRGVRVAFVTFITLFFALAVILPQFGIYMGRSEQTLGIKLLGGQVIGNYEIFVLKARASRDLNAWLSANGFNTFPQRALSIIDDYIAKNWVFVAAKLTKKDAGAATPHPISLKFKTERPIYPMRLTALPGSNLYLELFVVADKEAVPINYDLRKEYCNSFDYKDNASVIPADTLETRQKFVGRRSLGSERFRIRRRAFGKHDEIGHPEATKVMWDGCVVTKLSGELSSREMKEDMFFKLKNVTPFRVRKYSFQGAIVFGLRNAILALVIGMPILTYYYRRRLSTGSIAERSKRLAKVFSGQLFACLIVFSVSYFAVGEKTEVQISGRPESAWRNFITTGHALIVDLGAKPGITDAELKDFIKNIDWLQDYGSLNPFTNGPILNEASPGNFTIVRKNGLFAGINLYWRDGTPYFIRL